MKVNQYHSKSALKKHCSIGKLGLAFICYEIILL